MDLRERDHYPAEKEMSSTVAVAIQTYKSLFNVRPLGPLRASSCIFIKAWGR